MPADVKWAVIVEGRCLQKPDDGGGLVGEGPADIRAELIEHVNAGACQSQRGTMGM